MVGLSGFALQRLGRSALFKAEDVNAAEFELVGCGRKLGISILEGRVNKVIRLCSRRVSG